MNAFKCLTLTAVVIAAMLLLAIPATAGDYHYLENLVCSDCHTMHYSVTHAYDGGAGPTNLAGGPNARLLKTPSASLCLACHDGSASAPDVLNANTGTHVREAGGLNKTSGNTGGYDTYMGHTLGSTATAPGGTFNKSTGLSCGDCHSTHNGSKENWTDVKGNSGADLKVRGAWRNLKTVTKAGTDGQIVSYETGTNTGLYDIFETDPALDQVATHYDISNVDFNEPVSTASGIGDFCKKCHTNFHGDDTSTNMNNGSDWLRHPTADADLSSASKTTRWDTLTSHPKLMGDVDAGTATPTCITCHKAHGNQNPFGLIYTDGAGGDMTEQGDGGTEMRDTCRQCHSQGG